MATDKDLNQFVINKLTQQQYDSIVSPSEDEMYFITDGKVSADDVDDTNSTNKFVTSSDITTWNGKVTSVNNTYPDANGNVTITVPSQVNADWNAVSGAAEILNKPNLATVATTGSYSDLTGTPTIPTSISDLTDDTATTPIDKADTLTGLTATITELNYCDGVTSDIQTQLNGKQGTLVSGTNIKTINGNSLVGAGNITTEGSGGLVSVATDGTLTGAGTNELPLGVNTTVIPTNTLLKRAYNINLAPFDITTQLVAAGSYHCDANGDVASNSSWRSYRLDASKFTITSLTVRTGAASTRAYIAYYKTEEFTSADGNCLGVQTPVTGEFSQDITYTNLNIPEGTKYIGIFTASKTTVPPTYGLYVKHLLDGTEAIRNITDIVPFYSNSYIPNDTKELTYGEYFRAYYVDLEVFKPTKFTAFERATTYNMVAFYSSKDTFDSTTFISGIRKNVGEWTVDVVVPEDAKVCFLIRYTGTYEDIYRGNVFDVEGYYYPQTMEDALPYQKKVIDGNRDVEKLYYVGDNNTDYSLTSVNSAIEQWKTDGGPDAIIYRERQFPSYTYRVGANKTYQTLKAAVAQWVTDGKPCATIYVDSGTYITTNNPSASANELTVLGSANRLTIIGEDRDSTIVKSTTGYYNHPAINVQGGNVTIKNITFIADHSDNPNFAYRLKNGHEDSSYNSAYAVHCDGGNTPGVVAGVIEFENCNMWSWQSCGLGSGTVLNGHLIVKDCDIRSFVPGTATDEGSATGTDEEKEAHAIYVHGSRGAIVYHTKSFVDGETPVASNESFTLINSRVYMKGGTCTMEVKPASVQDCKIISFVDNTFFNGIDSDNTVHVPQSFYLNEASGGNNLSNLNSLGGPYMLMIK